jgi:molybdopterin-guanine dinucleotide biosynthesis protein A
MPRWRRLPLLMYALVLISVGLATHLSGALVFALTETVVPGLLSSAWPGRLLVVSGGLILLASGLAAVDLLVFLPRKRQRHEIMMEPPAVRYLTVVLTAFNDEASIALAVDDFRAHPLVKRVIVVDNNSTDRTGEVAGEHGAMVVRESQQGYGHCVYRALQEGMSYSDTELTLLCEGDMTFRAYDIDKFMSYIAHADIVNGTRIVEQLRAHRTQLTNFMYYGNFFVGKLLEAKHLGKGTFTDVGTTYKLCRNSALRALLPFLNPAINLEFNAHLLDTALAGPFHIVECPITFRNRVGTSKGGNTSNRRAFAVGMRMIRGIVSGWPRA